MSYYLEIEGIRYDRALVAAASNPLTFAAAARIAEKLADRAVITDVEADTIRALLRWPSMRRAREFLTSWWDRQRVGGQTDELLPGQISPTMAAVVAEGAKNRAAAQDCLRRAETPAPTKPAKPAPNPKPSTKPAKPAQKPKPAKPAQKPKPAKPAQKPKPKPQRELFG